MGWPDKFNYFSRSSNFKNDSSLKPAKAKEMLRDGTVHGKPLSQKQKGLFGLIAGGGKPSRGKGYRG